MKMQFTSIIIRHDWHVISILNWVEENSMWTFQHEMDVDDIGNKDNFVWRCQIISECNEVFVASILNRLYGAACMSEAAEGEYVNTKLFATQVLDLFS